MYAITVTVTKGIYTAPLRPTGTDRGRITKQVIVRIRDVHGNGIPIPVGFSWESHGNGNTNMPKMGMGMGRVHVTMGMGMATFSCVPKFPLG